MNNVIKEFREFFKKQFDNSSWIEITDKTEQFILTKLKERDRTIKFLQEQVEGIPNPSYSQNEVDRLLKEERIKTLEEVKKDILKLLRGMEIQDGGIDANVNIEDVPKELFEDLEKFKDGYITCLNEVKKAILEFNNLKN